MSIISEAQKNSFEDLSEHVLEYVDTRWDLMVLNFTEKALSALYSMISILVLTFFGGTVLSFLGLGLAFWLGQLMGSLPLGFVCVAVIFALFLFLIIGTARRYVRVALTNSILDTIKDVEENVQKSEIRTGEKQTDSALERV